MDIQTQILLDVQISKSQLQDISFFLLEGLYLGRVLTIKQSIIASSTIEAEFVACYEATSQTLWLRSFIAGLRVVDSISTPLRIYCDNLVAVYFSKNNKVGAVISI